jgi:hypothetical protein
MINGNLNIQLRAYDIMANDCNLAYFGGPPYGCQKAVNTPYGTLCVNKVLINYCIPLGAICLEGNNKLIIALLRDALLNRLHGCRIIALWEIASVMRGAV